MQKQIRLISIAALSVLVSFGMVSPAIGQSRGDKKSEAKIRQALMDWVTATNHRDKVAADTVWAKNVIGWFPQAPEFSGSAAFAVAGVPESKGASYSTYELKIEEIAVSGSLAAVHDIWTETKHFEGSSVTARRIIRGSEMWRRQQGKWQIARWVSAPEKWEKVE